jgi:DNA-binding GntR family transcriptional regulator
MCPDMREHAAPSSLASEAYGVVRQRILRGEIALGQVISRRKLAAELSMSFLPVSEALLRLEFEGMLESRPRAGTRVRIPSPEDVKGHYVVREALEVQAAVRFTQVATEAERTELRKLALRVDALSTQSNRTVYLEVHQELHARIAQCARCPVLLDAIEKTHALASIWFCVMRKPQPGDSPRRHADLVEAICSDDPLRASEAVRQHIAVGMERSLDVLQPYFKLRKATGRTFYRSDKRLRQGPPDLSQLH